ncbi:perlucin-like protein [Mizuhopecten yessoensis]|uniref:Perlucin-like protein n=1 Tax=Mizuhopecten yessoensis TaxID=6573 RepID=A0A210QR62_MIZYE|nr:perlucin-like protein [Mizuhopecten yessoensis]OWF51215.1 Perlucin-like protein [Mizuhopecten yessoensis]
MIGNILLLLNIVGALIQACPSGWTAHGERCYFFSVVVGSWADAGSYCRNFRGKLAEPRDSIDVVFLDGEVRDKHVTQGEYYLGGADFFVEGEWEWASSFDSITNSHWGPGEPNDHYGREDCLALTLSGFWNDVPCNTSLPFVCEIENDYSQGTIG